MTPKQYPRGRGFVMVLATCIVTVACDRGADPLAPTGVARSGAAPGSHATPAAGAPASPSIGGTWHYNEEAVLVFPGVLTEGLGIESEGPVLHVRCSSPDGVLELTQIGSTVTGTLVHPSGTCLTKGGQPVPTPWALPYRATIAGRIAGLSLHLEQSDDPPDPAGPVQCSKTGSLEIAGGEVVALTTRGRCDLSALPFRPATATNSATAVPM